MAKRPVDIWPPSARRKWISSSPPAAFPANNSLCGRSLPPVLFFSVRQYLHYHQSAPIQHHMKKRAEGDCWFANHAVENIHCILHSVRRFSPLGLNIDFQLIAGIVEI